MVLYSLFFENVRGLGDACNGWAELGPQVVHFAHPAQFTHPQLPLALLLGSLRPVYFCFALTVRPQTTRLFFRGVRIDCGVAVDSKVSIAAGEPILVFPGEGEEFLTTDIVQYQLMHDRVSELGEWILADTDEGSIARSFRLPASVGSTFISSRCVRGGSESNSSPLALVYVRGTNLCQSYYISMFQRRCPLGVTRFISHETILGLCAYA